MKTWILAHGFWIVVVAVGIIGFRSWLVEHDARLLADEKVKVSEAHVVDLQQQIEVVAREKSQKVQVVTRIVHDVKTPQQAVVAIPQLTDAPLNTRVLSDSPSEVAVNALTLVDTLGQCKQDAIELGACQATAKIQKEIIEEKTTQVEALRKPKSFWKRVGSTLKIVVVGVGIGVGIGLAI